MSRAHHEPIVCTKLQVWVVSVPDTIEVRLMTVWPRCLLDFPRLFIPSVQSEGWPGLSQVLFIGLPVGVEQQVALVEPIVFHSPSYSTRCTRHETHKKIPQSIVAETSTCGVPRAREPPENPAGPRKIFSSY